MGHGPEQQRGDEAREGSRQQGDAQQEGKVAQYGGVAQRDEGSRHLAQVMAGGAADGDTVDRQASQAAQEDHHQHGGEAPSKEKSMAEAFPAKRPPSRHRAVRMASAGRAPS